MSFPPNSREIHQVRALIAYYPYGVFREDFTMARPKEYEEERVTTAIRFPVSLHRRLKELAKDRDVSVSYLVTKAAHAYAEKLISQRDIEASTT